MLTRDVELGYAEDCNLPHRVEEFARLNRVHPSTAARWKRQGMPYAKRTGRIYCQAARDWLKGVDSPAALNDADRHQMPMMS